MAESDIVDSLSITDALLTTIMLSGLFLAAFILVPGSF
jgi:hypothetical protein